MDAAAFLEKHAEQGKFIPAEAFKAPDFLTIQADERGIPQVILKPEAAIDFKKD
jgi:hypothetical protein